MKDTLKTTTKINYYYWRYRDSEHLSLIKANAN